MKVEVLKRITHRDKLVEPGEQVVMDQQTAAILIGRGVVKEVSDTKPKPPTEVEDGAS